MDGLDDLLLSTSTSFPVDGELLSLHNAGGGRLETVWQIDAAAVSRFPIKSLEDLNGDGRPDLIAGFADPFFWPSYETDIWWGDGLGRFHRSNGFPWGISPGAVGHFRRGGGLDVARIQQFNYRRANLELFCGLGTVKERDEDPPVVEITLLPIVDRSVEPTRFDGSWRIAAVPIDDCDDRPVVERRVIELLPLAPDSPIGYRSSPRRVIEVFESRGATPARRVLLSGPDEVEIRGLLEQARTQGGFSFEHWGHPLRLASTASYGPTRAPDDPGARQAQRFEFETSSSGPRLVAASQTHPETPLMIAAIARDASGRRGTTHVSLPEARAAALARICREEAAPLYLCP